MRQILIFGIAVSLLSASTTFAAPNDVWRVDSIVAPAWNYEMLAGDSIRPAAVFRNVSATPHSFTCTFRIRNAVTGSAVYWQRDSLINLAANTSQRIAFPEFISENNSTQSGTFLCDAFAAPLAKDSAANPDSQPGDDTLRRNLFILQQLSYYDGFNNNFSVSPFINGAYPNVTQWVNHGAHVVDGDSFSLLPPPPNGLRGDTQFVRLHSPVIRLDRRDADGNFYPSCVASAGDTIESFPMQMYQKRFNFSYQRGGKISDAGGLTTTLSGPERTVTTPSGDTLRDGDRLILEFADTNQTTNITTWHEVWSSDSGHAGNYTRVFFNVDSSFTSNHFRYRFRLAAQDNSIPGLFADDDDAWFIDNISITFCSESEAEFTYAIVRPEFAFTHLPPRQANAIPLETGVFNNVCGNIGDNVGVQFNIERVGSSENIFSRIVVIPDQGPFNQQFARTLWYAGKTASGIFTLTSFLESGFDNQLLNDTVSSLITLHADSVMALDDGVNDVAQQLHAGAGLNLPPTSSLGGDGSRSTSSGSIAMKFSLNVPDTIRGAMVWFGSYDTSATPIEIKIYHSAGDHPGAVIADPCATLTTTRSAPWDTYHQYKFSCPVALDTGDYWLGVTQKISGALELGGSAARSACEWVVYDSSSSQQHVIVPVHRELADKFAWEDSANSGRWNSFYPAHGFPAYGNRSNKRIETTTCGTQQITHTEFANEGSWIPLLRPYFGGHDTLLEKNIPGVTVDSFTSTLNYPGSYYFQWSATNEQNIAGYFIESYVSAGNWTTIPNSYQPAYGGADTTVYYYETNPPGTSTIRWRLVAVGVEGDMIYPDSIYPVAADERAELVSFVVASNNADTATFAWTMRNEQSLSNFMIEERRLGTQSWNDVWYVPATNDTALKIYYGDFVSGTDSGTFQFRLSAIGMAGDTIVLDTIQLLMFPRAAVALITFTASVIKKGEVSLHWRTNYELNVSTFLIQSRKRGTQPWLGVEYPSTGNENLHDYFHDDYPGADTGVVEFRLSAIGVHNDTLFIDTIDVAMTPGAVRNLSTPPSPILFLQNYPDPFSDNTTIAFNSGANKNYSLSIIDMLGRTIRTLATNNFVAGISHATWDGRDDHNNLVPAGTYCCRLRTAMEQCEMMMRKVR